MLKITITEQGERQIVKLSGELDNTASRDGRQGPDSCHGAGQIRRGNRLLRTEVYLIERTAVTAEHL